MADRIKKTIDQYNKIASQYAKNITSRSPKEEIERFKSLLLPHDKVLDVGCSAGRDCRILKDAGYDVLGIDLSEKLLEIARKNNPDINFKLAGISTMPFPDKYFSGLWINAVFHHLEKKDMTTALQEVNRVLKQHGILYMKTKKGQGDILEVDELSVGKKREFTLLIPKELEQMVREADFTIIELFTKKDLTRDLDWNILFARKS